MKRTLDQPSYKSVDRNKDQNALKRSGDLKGVCVQQWPTISQSQNLFLHMIGYLQVFTAKKKSHIKLCKFIQYLLSSSSQYLITQSFWILWLLLTSTQNFLSVGPTVTYFLSTILTRLTCSGCWKTPNLNCFTASSWQLKTQNIPRAAFFIFYVFFFFQLSVPPQRPICFTSHQAKRLSYTTLGKRRAAGY